AQPGLAAPPGTPNGGSPNGDTQNGDTQNGGTQNGGPSNGGARYAGAANGRAGPPGGTPAGPATATAMTAGAVTTRESNEAKVADETDDENGDHQVTTDPVPPQTIVVTLRQRPWITRGMLTALILLAIIALWAAIFLFGLRQVFAADPPTKTAPASFYVAADIVLVGSAEPGPAPAGALPKDGSMPSGLGGTIAGTVTAASSGEPVGRIQVDALRPAADGSLVLASSSATQADGSYQVAGLFPAGYLLRFGAIGFDPLFYPAAPDQASATPVTAAAAQVTTDINVVITGQPASITGTVDPGDTLQPVVTTVTARATQGATAGQEVATTSTDGANAYTLTGLPAPAVYELSFTAEGYQPSVVQTTVDGGAARIQPTVLLSAGPGRIAGTVTDGTTPIGGVTVSTMVDGKEISTGTPTTGAVGRFVLENLPTPATYVLTVSGPGFGGNTVVVDLGPGQLRDDLAISLAAGTGQITGQLIGTDGAGIGGAVVTVGGMTNPPTTNTVTAGTVGAFSLAGLPAGASLTLTFDKPGYAPTTVPVQLAAGSAPLTVTMADSLGRIGGTVSGTDGAPITGATVTATDGKRSWPVTSSSASPGTAAGGYVIAQLPVGAYTVTATGPLLAPRTTLVTVTAGGQATADFVLPADPTSGLATTDGTG
ncbi:MAG: carboxypeptidase-like regulatory domain-containing protein, partial [Nakamurella sp.]